MMFALSLICNLSQRKCLQGHRRLLIMVLDLTLPLMDSEGEDSRGHVGMLESLTRMLPPIGSL